MKKMLKSKVMILFIVFVFAIACIQEQSIKKASAENTDNQLFAKNNYTLSVTQK